MQNKKRFTGNENHSITTAEAVTFTRDFKEHFGPETAPGCFFDKQAVRTILDQSNAVGMRYYYGTDDFDQTKLVLVGTDARQNDLLKGEPVITSMMNPPMTARGLYDRDAVRHEISPDEAAKLTARYRENLLPGQPKGGFFGKKAIQRLLDEPECVGLRLYFGAKKDGTRVIVVMCVDKFGAEMFYGPIAEISMICPPICGWPNFLNSEHGLSRSKYGKIFLQYANETD